MASGFPAASGTPAELLARWANQEYELVVSDHILHGLWRAWQKPYFRLRYSAERVEESLRLLRRMAIVVEPANDVANVADNEEDDLVIATAVAGTAGFLVTGDKPLRALGAYQGIVILSPTEFLEVLDREAPRFH